MKSDQFKSKKEVLLKEGWKVLQSEFDFNYFITKDPLGTLKEFGYFLSTLAKSFNTSPLGCLEQYVDTSFIKPFHFDKKSSVITLMTANSIARWDEAALRKGCIHKIMQFDKVKLSFVEID